MKVEPYIYRERERKIWNEYVWKGILVRNMHDHQLLSSFRGRRIVSSIRGTSLIETSFDILEHRDFGASLIFSFTHPNCYWYGNITIPPAESPWEGSWAAFSAGREQLPGSGFLLRASSWLCNPDSVKEHVLIDRSFPVEGRSVLPILGLEFDLSLLAMTLGKLLIFCFLNSPIILLDECLCACCFSSSSIFMCLW